MTGACNAFVPFVWALVFAEMSGWSVGFSVSPTSFVVVQPSWMSSTSLFVADLQSEFSEADEENLELNGDNDMPSIDFVAENPKPKYEQSTHLSDDIDNNKQRPEYGAMSPGTVVQVQIGDLSLARKAWKKRRRTGSPLLVPCSVLNADQRSMVRWNLIFLLEKFGKAQADGIQITASELSKRYRTFLRSSLQKQSSALGFESSHTMIMELFNKKVQESYGIRLVESSDGELVLKAPMSRTKAQKRAARTPILQFREPKPGDRGNDDLSETLTHTGFLRTRKAQQDSSDRSYHFLPLSAALRVSQKDDVNTCKIEEGSIHAAVVFDYDLTGDAGSPLLTLSLNPNGIRENLKVKPDRKFEHIDAPKHLFHDLKVGDGPYRAKVVRLQYGRALIDMDVGRTLSSEGLVRVLGTLRFKDSVEFATPPGGNSKMAAFDDDGDFDFEQDFSDDIEDALFDFDDDLAEEDMETGGENLAEELQAFRPSGSFDEGTFEDGEEEEDISALFHLDEDGVLSYTDPDTGETIVLEVSDDEEVDNDDEGQAEEQDEDTNFDYDDFDFDMTTLFEQGEDGTVAFIDPESGEALEVQSGDEEFEDMMMIKSLIDKYSRPPSPQNVDYIYSENQPVKQPEKKKILARNLVSKRLRVGQEVDVYIRTVSKQTGQFTVTTNPTVQGRKAKDLKQESSAIKKLDRLKKRLGGSLQRIRELEGQECGGTVRATSYSGEWLYVQPELDNLPVGIATVMQGLEQNFAVGDNVRVRIAGVDEQRGQLAMDLLSKLGP